MLLYTSVLHNTQLCRVSRSAGEWRVAEGVLTALITACLGNEKACRRLIRVGLDQLIDAAEDKGAGSRLDTGNLFYILLSMHLTSYTRFTRRNYYFYSSDAE